MIGAYASGGIDAAMKEYEAQKKLRPDIYNFGEGQ